MNDLDQGFQTGDPWIPRRQWRCFKSFAKLFVNNVRDTLNRLFFKRLLKIQFPKSSSLKIEIILFWFFFSNAWARFEPKTFWLQATYFNTLQIYCVALGMLNTNELKQSVLLNFATLYATMNHDVSYYSPLSVTRYWRIITRWVRYRNIKRKTCANAIQETIK